MYQVQWGGEERGKSCGTEPSVCGADAVLWQMVPEWSYIVAHPGGAAEDCLSWGKPEVKSSVGTTEETQGEKHSGEEEVGFPLLHVSISQHQLQFSRNFLVLLLFVFAA